MEEGEDKRYLVFEISRKYFDDAPGGLITLDLMPGIVHFGETLNLTFPVA